MCLVTANAIDLTITIDGKAHRLTVKGFNKVLAWLAGYTKRKYTPGQSQWVFTYEVNQADSENSE